MLGIGENSQNDGGNMELVEFYDHVPDFIVSSMENIYQSIFTTVARMRIYGALNNASTYVVRDGEKIRTVFIFRREKNRIIVSNEQINIESDEIKKFADAIFYKYKEISCISFYAVGTDFDIFPRPYQKLNCLEDIVVQLPRKAEDYLRNLSENTRASIRRSQKKLKLNFPSIQFETCCKEDISEEQIRGIVALNRARMSAKKRRFHYDEDAIQKMMELIRAYGCVMIGKTISGMCAGTICYRVGEHYFMHILAHDPKYDGYGLGKLCCYLSVCDAINNGAIAYHFGWGRTNYKYAMGAKNIDLYRIEIYRSRARLAGNIGHFFQARIFYELRRYKLWIECVDQGNTKLDRRVLIAMKALRQIKSYIRLRDKNRP